MCLHIGAEIDCEDKNRNAALHIAARYGHELIITSLIKNGANTTKLVTTDIQPSVYLPTEFSNKKHTKNE